MKSFGLASLSLLAAFGIASTALAQAPDEQPLPPPPPGGAEPEPPAPAAPAGDPGAPVAPAAPAAPVMQPQPAPPATGAGASAGASWSTSGGFDANASGTAPEMGADQEREWRRFSLQLQNNLRASTGLLHTSAADSGAPGTFRISLITSYFTGSGFLCDGSAASCPNPESPGDPTTNKQDEVTRLGAHLGINATLVSFLEAYLGLHATATENDQGRPQLLQVLGDMDIGLKGFLPHNPDQIFSVGGELNLWLLNGTGGVGLNGDGTSFTVRGLATADLNNRTNPDDRVPLRMHLNLGYHFDNSGNLVEDTELNRGQNTGLGDNERLPITRIERFGLDINKVDSFQAGVGLEGVFPYIRPFAEWTIDIPVNRQDYVCNTSRRFPGDECLGDASGFSTSPSRVTIGARGYPPMDGLALLLAVDIGTGGTSDFIEEVAPEPPWQIYFGAGFAFDTKPPEPIVKQVEVERLVGSPVAADRYITGTVVEKGTGNPVPNAIVRFDGRNLTGMVAGEDGSFRTIDLEPGTYTFNVTADGYREGQCTATIPTAGGAGAPGGPPGPYYQPGAGAPVAPTGPGAPPGPYYGGPGGAPAAGGAQGPTIVSVRCELEALPKVGNVVGGVIDADSKQPVAGAKVKITDKLNRELELTADQAGAFRFENVPPGATKITVDAPGYLTSVTEFEVQPRDDFRATVSLNKRPATPNVVVAANEVKLRKQVHFAHDSAVIEPDSAALLEEIADVLNKREDIKRVEIQGHTDNTGTKEYNQRLSQSRADAVRESLVKLGVDSSRLDAKGYGQDKPLVPNVSAANRARNRRVQIMITEKGK